MAGGGMGIMGGIILGIIVIGTIFGLNKESADEVDEALESFEVAEEFEELEDDEELL